MRIVLLSMAQMSAKAMVVVLKDLRFVLTVLLVAVVL